MSILMLAEQIGSVTRACRVADVDRTSFYAWKKRFEERGIEGLKALSPARRSHPLTTPHDIVERVLALSMRHPDWGCNRLSNALRSDGVAVSFSTIQRMLNSRGLGTRSARCGRKSD